MSTAARRRLMRDFKVRHPSRCSRPTANSRRMRAAFDTGMMTDFYYSVCKPIRLPVFLHPPLPIML